MTNDTGKTKRYCQKCRTRHSFKSHCKVTKTTQDSQPKASRKRRRQELISHHNPSVRQRAQHRKPTKLEGDASCPVCLEVKGRQHQLGCGHSLCQECYTSMTAHLTTDDKILWSCGRPWGPAVKMPRCPMCRADMFRGKAGTYLCDHRPHTKPRSFPLVSQLTLFERDDEDEFPMDREQLLEEQMQEEQEEQDYLEDAHLQDLSILSDAIGYLAKWQQYGSPVITRVMEHFAGEIIMNQYGRERPDLKTEMAREGVCLDHAQALVVGQLVEIYNCLFTVDPPNDPYGWEGQVIGELRRIFGQSTWVTRVDLEKLGLQNENRQLRLQLQVAPGVNNLNEGDPLGLEELADETVDQDLWGAVTTADQIDWERLDTSETSLMAPMLIFTAS